MRTLLKSVLCCGLPLALLGACETDSETMPQDAGGDAADALDPGALSACEAALQGITPQLRCDGIADCSSNEDEQDCPDAYACAPYGFRQTVQTIPAPKVCDGVVDCHRGEDEADCPDASWSLCSAGDEDEVRVHIPEENCDGHSDCYWGEDERDCPGAFKCWIDGPGGEYIGADKVCDGVWDCANDESDCPDAAQAFTCPDGKKLDRKWMCDDIEDCTGPEAADETDPSCHQFRCGPPASSYPDIRHCSNCRAQYVDESRVCDGTLDCDNHADELNCPELFACANGLSLRGRARCDGKPDCPGGEDELSCP
jgi:hypothetical protein